MSTIRGSIKMKKLSQSKSDASGWNKHVNKLQKRIANKVMGRMLSSQAEE